MNIRSLKSALTAVAIGATAFAPVAASAQSHHHHGGSHHHSSHRPGSWHGGGHYWSGRHYYSGPRYGYYDDDDDSGAWVAGTIFGLAAGAIAAGAANSGRSVAYCEQRFRSYDPASGTYLGYDGYRHPCP
jgi:hypothetical protein